MPILGTIASGISGHLTPPDTGAMFPLGMVQVGSAGASTVTFSSIPADYTHLQIRGILRNTAATASSLDLFMNFNGDTGTNYRAYKQVGGEGN